MFNANRIKSIRIESGNTQTETAKFLNVSRSSYGMWENGSEIIPIKRLIDFCGLYKVRVDYILELTNNKKRTRNKFNIDIAGLRLKEFRTNFSLTQSDLANYLNTVKTVICGYEKGRYLIATPFLYSICTKYQISADYLLGRIKSSKL